MSAVGVSMGRTIGFARNFPSTALTIGGFLVATGVMFSFGLHGAEGGSLSLASVWAASVSPFLPVLAALLSMDVWSDERLSGRIDILLTSPVSVGDLVLGKCLGVWVMTVAAMAVSFIASLLLVHFNAPSAFGALGVFDFMPGLSILCLQSALWCAVSVAASAFFRHAAAAAMVSCFFLVALPRGLWTALAEWSPAGRTAFGEMPFDAHASDFAAGVVDLGSAAMYAVFAAAAVFVCIKRVEAMRLAGRRAASARTATLVAALLSVVLAGLLGAFSLRIGGTVELPVGSMANRISKRTIAAIADMHGSVSAICLLPRNDPRMRSVAQLLRSLSASAKTQAGVKIVLRFVDPRWDFSAAQRLANIGVYEPSVVFELDRRRAVLSLKDGLSERNVASAMRRLAAPPHRTNIYWTTGHGESSFDSYGAFGMSDFARELSKDGFKNSSIRLSGETAIPPDCALIVVAGGKEDISRVEAERLDSYLKQGGRLLVLLGSGGGGLSSILSSWGVRISAEKVSSAHTLSGGDVVASEFSGHAITDSLSGTQIVLDSPFLLTQSSAVGGSGADRIEFSPLVSVSGRCIAAATERGRGIGEDLALRPTRIVVVGDSLFARNGPLASRANANMDFLLNCVAYLAGTAAITGGEVDSDVLATGMDRRGWTSFTIQSGLVVPVGLFLMMLAYVAFRRRRL